MSTLHYAGVDADGKPRTGQAIISTGNAAALIELRLHQGWQSLTVSEGDRCVGGIATTEDGIRTVWSSDEPQPVDQTACQHEDLQQDSPGQWSCERCGSPRHVVYPGQLHRQWPVLTGRAAQGAACVICGDDFTGQPGKPRCTVGRHGPTWVFACEGACYAEAVKAQRAR
ncbi:hypothetical protein [Actinopolymorpha pittospori]|uniref:Uncharacterized protein n=1 Tax=Actinopolymorpha pittospori TaxID=648752 RepID=A0A927MPH1_9ACTN|nr:hypothetical protein [Actinopolymorpha pittospori]MBE1604284.1 hypothetical protein [Actinopolymorpha pittospori]